MLPYTENYIATFSAKCGSPILNYTLASHKNYILHCEKGVRIAYASFSIQHYHSALNANVT